MTAPAESHDNQSRWQFSLRHLFVLLIASAVLFGAWREWPVSMQLVLYAVGPGAIGFLIAGGLALLARLSQPGQWLVGGVGFAIGFLNMSAVSSKGSAFSELGWPLPFLTLADDEFWFVDFIPPLFAIDLVACSLFLWLALRFAKSLEGTWWLVGATRHAVMLGLILGPAAVLEFARTAALPWRLMVDLIAIAVVSGIIWGACQASRGNYEREAGESEKLE